MVYKPLKDYTLGDLRTVCTNIKQNCHECMFRSIGCHATYPAYFDLSDKIVFTPEEVGSAEELIRCFDDEAKIKKASADSTPHLCWLRNVVSIKSDVFPTLSGIDSYEIRLKDIVEEGAAKIESIWLSTYR